MVTARQVALFTEVRTILSLCDFTGAWSQPYVDAGYDVIRVDLKRGSDVRLMELPEKNIHGILAAPECTVFAGSGARWWDNRTDNELLEALALVDACLRFVTVCKPVWWALENPVGRLGRWLGAPQMYFQPCDYGDPYTKRTGLWGEFNTSLRPTTVVPTEGSKMHMLPPGPKRQEQRSVTPAGFAKAFFDANP